MPGNILSKKRIPPTYAEMAAGPLRVRLLPGTATPTLMHYVVKRPAERIIAAVQRLEVGDSWYLSGADDLAAYARTGQPILLAYDVEALLKHRLANDRRLAEVLDWLEKNYSARCFSFQAGEWENWLGEDPRTVFRLPPLNAGGLDRPTVHAHAVRAFRDWKRDVRGHLHSVNGGGLICHLGAEAGEDFVGIETGENLPATQVQRAFARGAARQFGLPWYDQISQWFRETVPSGAPVAPDDLTPGGAHATVIGAHTGHSPSMLERLWSTAWFSGAAGVNIEAATGYLFNVPYGAGEFPAAVELSEYGRRARNLFRLMKQQPIGIPYAPFAVLVDKYHGWNFWGRPGAVWGRPWARFDETIGDQMTMRFFDQIFPGQALGPGNEERYLCPSPYGDTFDVLVNGAERRAWGAYPVMLAVGDISWTAAEIEFLKSYVQQGGLLALNEVNIPGWERSFLGLAKATFQPAEDARVVLSSPAGAPLLIRKDLGEGHLFVSALRPEPATDLAMAFPNAFLQELAAAFIPFRVAGRIETLINRTAQGWALLLVNNNGFSKAPAEQERRDPAAEEHVRISFHAKAAEVGELLAGAEIRTEKAPAGALQTLEVKIAPGAMRLLTIAGQIV